MKLYELTKIIEKIASLEHVNSIFEGDVYDLNTNQDVKYPAFVITQGQHTQQSDDNFIVNYSIFFVDRLLEDKTNELEIQSWANDAVKNVVNTLTDYNIGYVSGDTSVTTFTERFDSLCAGAFANVAITINSGDCDAVIKLVTSVNGKTGDVTIPTIDNLKTINGQSIIGEGNIEIKGGVESVNGKTGEVELTLSDITDESFVKQETFETVIQTTTQVIETLSTNINTKADKIKTEIIEIEEWEEGILKTDGTVKIPYNNIETSGFVPIDYIYSCSVRSFKSTVAGYCQVTFHDINKNVISYLNLDIDPDNRTIEFTAPQDASYFRFCKHVSDPRNYTRTFSLDNTNEYIESLNYGIKDVNNEFSHYKSEQSIVDESQNIAISSLSTEISDLSTAVENKQDALVSGQNIKTINNNSILGPGNITIQGGSDEQSLMFSRIKYHSYLAFLNGQKSSTFEYTTNGNDWITDTNRHTEHFAENDNFVDRIITDDRVGCRWTIISDNFSYSMLRYFVTSFGWTNPQAPVNIIIEGLVSGEWRECGKLTNYRNNTEWIIIPLNYDEPLSSLRITIIKTQVDIQGEVYLGSMRVYSLRPGNQGLGIEYEKPYKSNANRDIYPWTTKESNLGHTNYMWNNLYVKEVIENGTALVNKYANKETTESSLASLDTRIDELQLFKFPNVTIFGIPEITGGQLSGFSEDNYAQFPFLVDFHNQAFEINMCFTTGNQVTTQENIFDSIDGLAFAVRGGKFVVAMSSDGQTWNMGEHIGEKISVQPKTTYYVKLSWNRLQYKLDVSTDKINWTNDFTYVDSRSLYAKQIIIGKSTDNEYIFSGSINLNNCSLSIMGQLVWQGMDDAGIATRLATDLSNIDTAGEQKIKDIVDVDELVTHDYLEENYATKSNLNTLSSAYNTFVAEQTAKNNNYDAAINLFGDVMIMEVTFHDGTVQNYNIPTYK